MPVEIFPECPYPADVHYVDLPEVYKVMRRFERLFNALEVASQEHFDMIRTSLGHPENQEELAILEKKERERQFKSSKAINERDKELRSALVTTSTKQIADICNLTEKYLLEDDDRVAYSGKDFRMTPHDLCNSCSLAHHRVVYRAPPFS